MGNFILDTSLLLTPPNDLHIIALIGNNTLTSNRTCDDDSLAISLDNCTAVSE